MAIHDYLQIITSQHRDKQKFISFLTIFLEKIQDIEYCLSSFIDEFSLETARGKQQDILGEILNLNRRLFVPIDGSTGELDDATYYELLAGKVVRNSWDGSLYNLLDLWYTLFPISEITITDNQNMVVDVTLYFSVTNFQLQLLQNGLLLPKPVGVKINYTSIPDVLFAYDKDPGQEGLVYYSGYDTGEWENIL